MISGVFSMIVQIGRFNAADDNGKRFLIDVFQEFIDTPDGRIEGAKTLRTADGRQGRRTI
jgi:hypothetical protein